MNDISLISCILFSAFLCIFIGTRTTSADCDNLQDVCPTDPNKKESFFLNGFPCKNPSTVIAPDFKNSKFVHPGDTDNFFRSSMSIVTASEFLGLNTLGLSIGRTDLAVDGIVPPHSHPRGSEMFFVNKGFVIAGFIDTRGNLFQKVLRDGDVFVFPKGLLHFCFNAGADSSVIFSVLNSQNPGTVSINDITFGNGFDVVERLKRKFMASSAKNVSEVVDLGDLQDFLATEDKL